MALLVRKITKSKWMQFDAKKGDPISADALTNCMRTSGNTLSTWRIDDESQIKEAVLALAAAMEHLDKMDVVLMNQDALGDLGIKCTSSDGDTPVQDLRDKHVDLVELNYGSLGALADYIAMELLGDHERRYTKARLKDILKEAINSGRLDIGALKESVASEL